MERQDFLDACRDGGAAMAKAMRRLLSDYGPALQREAQACLGARDEARDLVQQALIKAWRRCASYRGDSELYPWLKSIVRHGAIDLLRRRAPEQALSDDEGRVLPEVERALQALAPTPVPEDELQQAERERCFQACAARFAAEHPQAAQVVRWIAEDGLAPADIAPLIGRGAGATREYVSQCRKKARLYFAPWYRLVADAPLID